jgi:hypothetical protein
MSKIELLVIFSSLAVNSGILAVLIAIYRGISHKNITINVYKREKKPQESLILGQNEVNDIMSTLPI